jgi:hypothetical protein
VENILIDIEKAKQLISMAYDVKVKESILRFVGGFHKETLKLEKNGQ